MTQPSLPIWSLAPDIIHTLESGNRLVLAAPTGSGKTTQIPQMLLDAGLARDKKIVVLQPRRVAARTVAARVAWERKCRLGAAVGYQVRFDDRIGSETRICYVTEGILLRWLQDDPRLSDISILIFDEFHERNLLSDVSLGLARQLQSTGRPDLKIIVMSATLDVDPISEYLSPCPVLISEGRMFPVDVLYLDSQDERSVWDQAADCVSTILKSGEPGDVLVFMPGMQEINGTIRGLHASALGDNADLIPLHGDLPPEQQDLAFAPSPRRKIIVATNVAETSVTIDGVRHVVDSGLARISRYEPERGISTLFVEPISQSSAEQRRGRAGRTAPGTCYRLWTESGQLNRPLKNTPEIQRSDLAEVVLLLHSLGVRQAVKFDWLDKPNPQSVERAERLLETLGALRPNRAASEAAQSPGISGASHDLTVIGLKMLKLPMHPRYSRMLVEAQQLGCVAQAALCAALVSGRDILMRLGRDDKHIKEARELFEGSNQSDFYTLMRAYQFARKNDFRPEACRRYGVHAQTAHQVEQTFEQIRRLGEDKPADASNTSENALAVSDDALLRCIMAGFIDQLCIRRSLGTLDCEIVGGRTGTLMRESVVQEADLFVAANIREVPGRHDEKLTLVGLASAVKRQWIEETFPDQVSHTIEHLYDRTHKRVAAIKLTRFHDLVIHHAHQRDVDPKASGLALAEAASKGLFELPLLNHDLKQLIARINLVAAVMPELQIAPFDAAALKTRLTAAFEGLTLVKEAQARPLRDDVIAHLAPGQLAWLDELAPQRITWPDGRKLKLIYPAEITDEDNQPNSPELQVKLHECFQLKEHPHIAEGKMPIKLVLSGPDGKRLETTFNWPAFKANTYPKLKAALLKKYPGVLWI
jgi:ATP-dependent helicase HrpB